VDRKICVHLKRFLFAFHLTGGSVKVCGKFRGVAGVSGVPPSGSLFPVLPGPGSPGLLHLHHHHLMPVVGHHGGGDRQTG